MLRERAEVTCLICGRNLGQIERVENKLQLLNPPESPNAARLVRRKGVGLACGHCGGRAYIGPMERVTVYAA